MLEEVEDSDAAAWLAGEDEEQLRAFEWPQGAQLADVQRAIAQWRAGWTTEGALRQWVVRAGDERALAGGLDLRDLGDWRNANLSYVIFPPFRRRRLATGAARLALEWGRVHLGIEHVRVAVLEWNTASKGVATSLGARWVSQESSLAGGTLDVFDLDLTAGH